MIAPLLLASAAALGGDVLKFPGLQLTVDVSAFEGLKGEHADTDHWLGGWSGRLAGHALSFDVIVYDRSRFRSIAEPGDVAGVILFNLNDRSRDKNAYYDFDSSRALEGSFGELGYGWIAEGERTEGTRVTGSDLYVCGVVPGYGYALAIQSEEPLDEKARGAVAKWAQESVRYGGPVLDPRWTDEEAQARFEAMAPGSLVEKMERKKAKLLIKRTEHYIVFTDLGPGTLKSFLKALEANHDKVREVFPFDVMPGERLLPVFYFREPGHYHEWYAKNLNSSLEDARRSAGVAYKDVYATYHQATKAPVHIHEQTHQLFGNRLRLGGGGSWFQEGVAEYMCSAPGDLAEIKRLAKKKSDGLMPLHQFMTMPSLLMSSATGTRKDGGSFADIAYLQAAAVIEFVKHGDLAPDRFLDWVHAIGQVDRSDIAAIERATEAILGVDLDEFEARFREYWRKRRSVRDWHAPA